MLQIFFGWKKASRCKKLIRRIQCRLKLLKNKRCSIVRQLRDDMAQLLKHGHEQKAFDRVEQIFLDQSIIEVYDILYHLCEFIIINISYIRKHKDYPIDIGEAVSTLIFASARCGDLPELLEIRKLFRERYGQKFTAVALDLLPGNLVNHQIKENLSVQPVADYIKWSLVNEIWRSCLQAGPLAIEYHPDLLEETVMKAEAGVVRSDIQSKYMTNDEPELQAFSITEDEGKIVTVDLPSDNRNPWAKPRFSYQESDINSISTPSPAVINSSPNSFELSTNSYSNFTYRVKNVEKKEEDMGKESYSSSSSQWPMELVYLDDIEEYKSPISKHVNLQDQRLFKFKSPFIISTRKLESNFNENYIKKNSLLNEKLDSGKCRKKKRQRRSVSRERKSVKDFESYIYYGEKYENSRKPKHRKKNQTKIPNSEISNSNVSKLDQVFVAKDYSSKVGEVIHECNLMEPCYFCGSTDSDGFENQVAKINTTKRLSEHSLQFLYSKGWKRMGEKEGLFDPKVPYSRTKTMPTQRPSLDHDENTDRSNSFPFQKPKSESPTCRHVHPKLPDYDQFVATFTALKKENSQIKSKRSV